MNILVISDSPQIFGVLEGIVVRKGYGLYHSAKRDNLRILVHHWDIRIIILQLAPDETKDFLPLRDIRNFDPLIDVILIGPPLPVERTLEAIHLGAVDYLKEPWVEKDILAILSRIQDKAELRKKTHQLDKQVAKKYVFEGMIGRSATMLEIFPSSNDWPNFPLRS